MDDVWVKRTTTDAAQREAAGLRWLAVRKGARIVHLLGLNRGTLRLERVVCAPATPRAARELGRGLARMHAAGAAGWGAPPEGTEGDGTIGRTTMRTPEEKVASWGEFYAGYRIEPHLRAAADSGVLTPRGVETIEQAMSRIGSGELDHPQPSAIGAGAARLHGDLWNGNVMWSKRGAILIDPAAHGGHAETDLAMLHLFGAPFLDDIIGGYQEVSQLADGWRDRVALHQLWPLLVHAELFGPDYGARAEAVAARYA